MSRLFNLFKRITLKLHGKNLGKIPGVRFVHKLLFKTLMPKRNTEIMVQGKKMIIDPNDKGVAQYLLLYGVYGEYETQLVRELIKPGMNVLDIGANIGYFTLIFSDLAGDSGRVWAFEPEPKNFSMLSENLRVNSIKNVEAVPKALSRERGHLTLFLDKSNLGNMSLSSENIPDHGGRVEVETVSLDECIGDQRVDFIKIDVQGAEGVVFDGAERVISKNKPKILVEFWPYGLKNLGTDPDIFLKKMEAWGYRFSILDPQAKSKRQATIEEIVRVSRLRPDGKGAAYLLCEQ